MKHRACVSGIVAVCGVDICGVDTTRIRIARVAYANCYRQTIADASARDHADRDASPLAVQVSHANIIIIWRVT